jgi:ABC-type uncharacterized transport system auxiliary subunit
MNNKLQRTGAILLLAAGLASAACGSSRPQHYTVAYTPSASGMSGGSKGQVGVAVPRASHLLRQDRIVYFTTDNELNFYARHRWAEPPNRMVQGLLIRQLRASGSFDDVVAYRAQKGLAYVLRGNLLSMEEVDSASEIRARFALELELVRQEDDHVVWTGRHGCERPVAAKTVGAVVDTMSGCVQESLTQLTGSLAAALPEIEAAKRAESTAKP